MTVSTMNTRATSLDNVYMVGTFTLKWESPSS